jgi:hypothetical protein
MGNREPGWIYGVLTLLLLGAAAAATAWAAFTAQGLDAWGLVLGIAALAATVWALGQSARSGRPDSAALVRSLAAEVRATESKAWQQLLSSSHTPENPVTKPINVRFTLRRARAHNASGAAEQGDLEDAAEYYRRLRPRAW